MNKEIEEGIQLAERILEYSDMNIDWKNCVAEKLAKTVILMKDEIDYLKGQAKQIEDFCNNDTWNEIRD